MQTPANEMQLERDDMCLTGRLAGDDVPKIAYCQPISRWHAVWRVKACPKGWVGTKKKGWDSYLSIWLSCKGRNLSRKRVLSRFFGMRDHPYLKVRFQDFGCEIRDWNLGMQDAKSNHRYYGIASKFGSGCWGWITDLLGTLERVTLNKEGRKRT